MDQQIALAARKADAAHDIATKARTEVDELRIEVAELKKWCKKLQTEAIAVQSQANSMETYSRRDNIIIYGIKEPEMNRHFYVRRLYDSCLWINSNSLMLKLQLYHL